MAKKTKIPIENIELVVNYVLIDDNKRLSDQNIDKKSKIYMVAKNLEKIPINITCEKNEFKIECTKPMYLNEIKELIRQKVRNLN